MDFDLNLDLNKIRNLPMYKLALEIGFKDVTGPRQEKANTLRLNGKNFGYVFLKHNTKGLISLSLRRDEKSNEYMGKYYDNEKGYSDAIIQCIYKNRGLRRPFTYKKLIEDIFINGIKQ